ncbi:hypothetical protein PM082_009553 [Marasmius tenuissimus]|nr:hypothetical protein PM082_009553 [Marasmius tenuissimus]
MVINTVLANASNPIIGDHATIHSVTGNATTTTNIYANGGRDLIDPYGIMFRRFPMGDITIRKDVSSEVLDVSIESQQQSSTYRSLKSSRSQVVKVKKTVQHVRLLGLPGAFTSVTVEPVNGGQAQNF